MGQQSGHRASCYPEKKGRLGSLRGQALYPVPGPAEEGGPIQEALERWLWFLAQFLSEFGSGYTCGSSWTLTSASA
eukprot:4778431-Pyramimonas_sp.AAC.1